MGDGNLSRVTKALSVFFKVPESVIDLDSNLLNPEGFQLGDRLLDSLEIVELIAVIEDTLECSLDAFIEKQDRMSLRELCSRVVTFAEG